MRLLFSRGAKSWIYLALCVFFCPLSSLGEQFILVDTVVVHTGFRRLYEDWDFVMNILENYKAPKNWLSPVNYADGVYHMRLEILSISDPVEPVVISFGFSNKTYEEDPTGQHCTWKYPYQVSKPGVYEKEDSVRSFWHGPADDKDPTLPWDFESAFREQSFFTIVDPVNDGKNTVFPLKMQMTVWIVSEGSSYEPPSTNVADDSDSAEPRGFSLRNYPNPFNPDTSIEFSVPEPCSVLLTIYDAAGRKVRELTDETYGAGTHKVLWDGLNGDGMQLAAGLYFTRLESAGYVTTGKMMFVK